MEHVIRTVGSIAGAALVTVVALRLLGMRRGWVSALIAGVTGWGIAVLVVLGTSGWDWGADGLALHLGAVGIPSTMAVAVFLDLLARPGSLAVGERAGLIVAPRPIRSLRRRIAVVRRYRELLRIARREGFLSPRDREEREAQPIRLRRVLESAGGVYVKLGQLAATRVDLLPPSWCDELARLQQDVAPEPWERIAEVLRAELGDIDTVFASFDEVPLAAASIGQTYCARLLTGEEVVVKVQRPDIAITMDRDLAALALVAGLVQRRTRFGRSIRIGDILDQFGVGLLAELDFRREADTMAEMAARMDGTSGVRIARVHRSLCTARVLVQERLVGRTVTEARHLDEEARRALASALVRSMLDQILRFGLFHADPHPGNVFVLDSGELGLIDLGSVGRLDPIQQAAVVDVFVALGRRDVELLRDGVERITTLDERVAPDELSRALARIVADHVRPGGATDPRVMQEMVVMLGRFGMRMPTDVLLLSRALATVDGTLRVLSPDVTLMAAVSEVVSDPRDVMPTPQEMVRDELLSALPRLRQLPERVDRLLATAGRGELRLRTVVDEDQGRILRTLVNRGLLAFVGAILLGVSAMLLVATEDGPAVAGETGLFEVFGYGGLLAGSVLVLRVLAAVTRDGTV